MLRNHRTLQWARQRSGGVARGKTPLREHLRRDAGSTMVTVLIVMLVLTIGGVAVSAIAMNTAATVTDTRHRSAAQAEVDGAIATMTVNVMTERETCGATQKSGVLHNGDSNTTPPITWTLDCSISGTVGTAVIQARSNVGGEEAMREAVLTYSLTPSTPADYGAPEDPIMMFGENTTFNSNNVVIDPDHPVNVTIPYGGFTCNTRFPGDLTVKGDIRVEGGCEVSGNVVSVTGAISGPGLKAGKDVLAYKDISFNGSSVVKGNLYSFTGRWLATGTDSVQGNVTLGSALGFDKCNKGDGSVLGQIGGNLHALGGFSSNSQPHVIKGSVIAGGGSCLRASTIVGTLTVPSNKSLDDGWSATVSGVRAKSTAPLSVGITRPSSVAPPTFPAMPELPAWFEYKYKESDWVGYEVVPLAAVGVGPGSCAGFTNSQGTWLTELSAAKTKALIIDARNCATLSTNYGGGADIKLSKNLILLANNFDLTNARVTAAAGVTTKPKVWVLKSDETPGDGKPTCSPAGNTKLNMSHFDQTVTTMVYTPCTIQVNGASSLYGQLYGGDWAGGGGAGITFGPDNIGVPGMGGGSSGGGGGGSEGGELESGSFVLQSTQDVPVP